MPSGCEGESICATSRSAATSACASSGAAARLTSGCIVEYRVGSEMRAASARKLASDAEPSPAASARESFASVAINCALNLCARTTSVAVAKSGVRFATGAAVAGGGAVDGAAAAAGDEATAFEPAAPLPIAPPLLPASPMLDEREARRGATLLLGAAAGGSTAGAAGVVAPLGGALWVRACTAWKTPSRRKRSW